MIHNGDVEVGKLLFSELLFSAKWPLVSTVHFGFDNNRVILLSGKSDFTFTSDDFAVSCSATPVHCLRLGAPLQRKKMSVRQKYFLFWDPLAV